MTPNFQGIAAFIHEAGTLLGEYAVTDSGRIAALMRDPSAAGHAPKVVLYPAGKEDLAKILALANKLRVPIWTHSTGKNWGYHTSATAEDSAVVILSRMNKILRVDSELAYAEIEPGVTYKQLNEYLRSEGHALWTDAPGGPPGGSVIGNALDRGLGVTEYSQHFANLCGLEVMLADGSVVRTGATAEDKQGAAAVYRWGVGPSWTGMFSQSNFGIVTRAAIWLMPEPADYSLLSFHIDTGEKLAAVLDVSRDLLLQRVLPGPVRFSNDVAMVTLITQAFKEKLGGGRALSAADLLKLKEKYRVPAWQVSGCLYGEKAIIKSRLKRAKKSLRGLCRVKAYSRAFCSAAVKAVNRLGEGTLLARVADRISKAVFGTSLALLRSFSELKDLHEGTPVEAVVKRAYFRHPEPRPDSGVDIPADGVGIHWFVPVLPFRGDEVAAYVLRCEEEFKRSEIDFYVTIFNFNPRAVCVLMALIFNRRDAADCKRANELYSKLLAMSHSLGYNIFRSGPAGWAHLYDLCPELGQLNKRVKDAVDPNGILAPGRYGI